MSIEMNFRVAISALAVALATGATSRLCSQGTADGGFLEAATTVVQKAYGPRANGMQRTFQGRQDGLIVSVEIPNSAGKARYWVMCEEVTSVSGRVPERKWKRVCCVGIEGPKYEGGWIRELTDEQYAALHQVRSQADTGVTDGVLRVVIRDMILPGLGPGFETEWHRGSFFVRAATAFVYRFDFRTPSSRGGNLIGVTLYLDGDGSVIAKSEAMLYVD
jgi:hypothetical protein